MTKSFYQFLMSKKGPSHLDELQLFATAASEDIQFPKHSQDCHEVSSYLEMNADYLSNMSLFDAFWAQYEEECQ
ncbi:YozE family protein [Enterococcus cecorum]|uniref:YozE family protein n=1 Tax=Enterococcus cecorum TaxID=44008 RepID=UPI003F8F4145